ncbi:hypothetical protein EW146_g4709 [Bondarzewia mesenterica]|uniref:CCHC-type domain-containing protein n=1 Tax=Bondarzewia mesenterica TaxID=1095465 RepID=A0A4S4LUS5_9AGAM|nr:hypothetical protein EW146_g4709 [Bondarzewia mesenterica]
MEDLATMFECITETFVKALSGQQAVAPPRPLLNPETAGRCTFYGNAGHYMQECPEVEDYICQGKCSIPNLWLKERIDEWHRHNPGQIMQGQLLLNVLSNIYYDHSAPDLADLDNPGPRSCDSLRLTVMKNPAITLLKYRAILLRRSCTQFHMFKFLHVQNKPLLNPHDMLILSFICTLQPMMLPMSHLSIKSPMRFHNHLQSRSKNQHIAQWRQFMMSQSRKMFMIGLITITQRELLLLSSEVHAQICKATAGRRIPQHDGGQAKILMQDDALPFALDDLDQPCDIENTSLDITTASFAQILYQLLIPPKGSLIIPDPYEAYFNSLTLDEEPEPLIVAKESSALRSILPLIDHQQ